MIEIGLDNPSKECVPVKSITNGLRFKKTEKNVIRYIKRDDLGIKHDLMIEHF